MKLFCWGTLRTLISATDSEVFKVPGRGGREARLLIIGIPANGGNPKPKPLLGLIFSI
jgi:hypothetical protein